MDFKLIDLKYPIPVKGENGSDIPCSQIKLGRLKTKHLKLLPKNLDNIKPVELIPLIAGMANLPIEAIEELDFEDLGTIAEELQSFLEGSQKSGTS